jgi:hypothetical protein
MPNQTNPSIQPQRGGGGVGFNSAQKSRQPFTTQMNQQQHNNNNNLKINNLSPFSLNGNNSNLGGQFVPSNVVNLQTSQNNTNSNGSNMNNNIKNSNNGLNHNPLLLLQSPFTTNSSSHGQVAARFTSTSSSR